MSRNWYYENAIIKIEKLPIKVYSGQIRRAFLQWIKINWSKSVLKGFHTSIKVISDFEENKSQEIISYYEVRFPLSPLSKKTS